jgi:hypothetical protein
LERDVDYELKCYGGPKDGYHEKLLHAPSPVLKLSFDIETKRLPNQTKSGFYYYELDGADARHGITTYCFSYVKRVALLRKEK